MNFKILAFYLPQYHPIPENDEWWGKGFTEWTNVGKAKPLYKGHEQPKFPADLGYYDLRVPETRNEQAKIAKEYGVHGFIYYHYWFGNGKQLLERPINEVIDSNEPDFPFCLCWANETWSGIWHGLTNKILAEQTYPGDEDIVQHFNYLLKAFKDKRYIKVDGKPMFMIYDAENIPDFYLEKLRILTKESGFPDLYLVGSNKNDDKLPCFSKYDAKVSYAFNKAFKKFIYEKPEKTFVKIKKYYYKFFLKKEYSCVKRINHEELVDEMEYIAEGSKDIFPIVLPNWDNTPRSGKRGVVLENSSPELLKKQILKSVKFLEENKNNKREHFIILKSWNEWAEGNYVEPDSQIGYGYLNIIKDFFKK